MMCESCGGQEASVHLTQIVEGEVKKLHLCRECAESNGISVEEPLSITELLLQIGANKADEEAEARDLSCPDCHMRYAEYRESSRLGCPTCYDAFRSELQGMVSAMQKADVHTGKKPRTFRRERADEQALASLDRKLADAVAGENFEEAARLRDEIRAARTRPAEDASRDDSR